MLARELILQISMSSDTEKHYKNALFILYLCSHNPRARKQHIKSKESHGKSLQQIYTEFKTGNSSAS